MRKVLIVAGCMAVFMVGKVSGGTNNFGAYSTCIAVSTTPSQPTLLFPADGSVRRTVIVNPSSYNICIGTANVTISTDPTTGNFYIPANSSWSPDGPNDPYVGKLYGVAAGATTAQTVCRQRSQ